MTAFSLRARLHLGANSDLALSLPQSSPLYPKRLDSSLLRGSRGGSAADHGFALGEHRGTEVRSPFAVRQKIKSHHNFAFWGGNDICGVGKKRFISAGGARRGGAWKIKRLPT